MGYTYHDCRTLTSHPNTDGAAEAYRSGSCVPGLHRICILPAYGPRWVCGSSASLLASQETHQWDRPQIEYTPRCQAKMIAYLGI